MLQTFATNFCKEVEKQELKRQISLTSETKILTLKYIKLVQSHGQWVLEFYDSNTQSMLEYSGLQAVENYRNCDSSQLAGILPGYVVGGGEAALTEPLDDFKQPVSFLRTPRTRNQVAVTRQAKKVLFLILFQILFFSLCSFSIFHSKNKPRQHGK